MQGLNTTPVHGHTALFGVCGLPGMGLVLFCFQGAGNAQCLANWGAEFFVLVHQHRPGPDGALVRAFRRPRTDVGQCRAWIVGPTLSRVSSLIYGSRMHTRDRRTVVLHDVLFDDRNWSVRYLAARLPRLLIHEDVLLTPEQLENAVWSAGELHTPLSMAEVKAAPSAPSSLKFGVTVLVRERYATV